MKQVHVCRSGQISSAPPFRIQFRINPLLHFFKSFQSKKLAILTFLQFYFYIPPALLFFLPFFFIFFFFFYRKELCARSRAEINWKVSRSIDRRVGGRGEGGGREGATPLVAFTQFSRGITSRNKRNRGPFTQRTIVQTVMDPAIETQNHSLTFDVLSRIYTPPPAPTFPRHATPRDIFKALHDLVRNI